MITATFRRPAWTIRHISPAGAATAPALRHDDPSWAANPAPIVTCIENGRLDWRDGIRSEQLHAQRHSPATPPPTIPDQLCWQAGLGVFVRLWWRDRELLTRRSGAVSSARHQWMPAAAESLECSDLTGGTIADWAARAVSEELGGQQISRFEPAGCDLVWHHGLLIRFWVHAHIHPDLSEHDIRTAADNAQDAWEREDLILATPQQAGELRGSRDWLIDAR